MKHRFVVIPGCPVNLYDPMSPLKETTRIPLTAEPPADVLKFRSDMSKTHIRRTQARPDTCICFEGSCEWVDGMNGTKYFRVNQCRCSVGGDNMGKVHDTWIRPM